MSYLLRDFIKETEESLDKSIYELSKDTIENQLKFREDINKADNMDELKKILINFIDVSLSNVYICKVADNKLALILSELRDQLVNKGIIDLNLEDENGGKE